MTFDEQISAYLWLRGGDCKRKGIMPVVTRSCSKQKSRPRIEEETPATTNVVRRRYATRSSVKRKILQQENEIKDLEPPTKVRRGILDV